jgi:hypothetical protein
MPAPIDLDRGSEWADLTRRVIDEVSRSPASRNPFANPVTRPDDGRTREARQARREQAFSTRRLHALAALFVRRMEYRFHIPGGHYSGLSNQELYEILAAQGRDFAAPSRRLDEHVRLTILSEFEGFTAPPSINALKQTAAMAIAEWVITRWEGRVRDVAIRRLPQGKGTWFERKRRLGLDLRVGIAKGDNGGLLEAARDATVKVTPNITAADVAAA